MENEYKLHRVNTKIPGELNDWLDEESRRTGLSKSSLIMLSVQAYYDQKTVVKRMGDMGDFAKKVEVMRELSERNDSE